MNKEILEKKQEIFILFSYTNTKIFLNP